MAWPMSHDAETLIAKAVQDKMKDLEPIWAAMGNWGQAAKPVWINIEENSDNSPKIPLPYKNYGSGQPNSENHQCLCTMHGENSQWDDRSCSKDNPFICEFYGEFRFYKKQSYKKYTISYAWNMMT